MHTDQSPEESGAALAERPFSGKIMGEIIHAVYGIDFEGNPTEPKTLAELTAVGYSEKEVNVSLKATLLQDMMESLAARIDGETFLSVETTWEAHAGEKKYAFLQPKDLLGADGNVDLAKRRIYLSALMANEAREQWLGPYRSAHPEAFGMLYELNRQFLGEPAEEVGIMEAADTGIDSILALHRRIELTDPTAPIGASMAISLPALYKIATQNMDTTGSPINLMDAGFVRAGDIQRETELRNQLRHELHDLEPDALAKLKRATMESLLDDVTIDSTIDERRITAIQDMDVAFDAADSFIGYLCGDPIPEDFIDDEATREYFDAYRDNIGTNVPGWFRAAEVTVPAGLQDTLIELDAADRIYALNPEYFAVQQEVAGEPMRIQLVTVERELGRVAERLFRQPVYVMGDNGLIKHQPADTITPSSKTVRCAAMYTNLATDNPKVQQACDAVDFHPVKMNGIAFIGLMDLVVTHQTLSVAKGA